VSDVVQGQLSDGAEEVLAKACLRQDSENTGALVGRLSEHRLFGGCNNIVRTFPVTSGGSLKARAGVLQGTRAYFAKIRVR